MKNDKAKAKLAVTTATVPEMEVSRRMSEALNTIAAQTPAYLFFNSTAS